MEQFNIKISVNKMKVTKDKSNQ